MATPTSYLQTLSQDDAIAFVTSLQKVRQHLSQQLEWMQAQVQQKTVQLEGVEALLNEATALNVVDPNAAVAAHTSTPVAAELSAVAAEVMPSASTHVTTPANSQTILSDADGQLSTINPDDAIALDPASVPVTTTVATENATSAQQGKRPKQTNSKPKGSSRATNAKKMNSSSQATKAPDLKQFLQAEFQAKPLMEAVAQVLDVNTDPLGLDDLMAKLYNGLSEADYKRAKLSLTNLLSPGKSKGKWQSAGRGLYVGKAAES